MHKIKSDISDNPIRRIRLTSAIYPILIGLGVAGYLFYREFNVKAFDHLVFTKFSAVWILVAFGFMILRDIGYMARLIVLTDGRFSLRQAFRVIMLWEFSSAITPSAIGGTSVAILYVNKEGLNIGHSSAVVMATSILDELYFVVMFPLVVLIVNPVRLFGDMALANELILFSLIGYSIKLVWVIAIAYGLFVNPRSLKWLLMMIFKLPLIRRWKHGANRAGTEIINSSIELRRKPFSFWAKAFGATIVSWTSRYWVVNAMFLAFFVVNEHILIFARQLVMWIMMLVSPTPGGSGFAEFVFTRYLGDFIPVDATSLGAVAVALALLWRIISYYPYLFIGVVLFPRWVKSKFVQPDVKPE